VGGGRDQREGYKAIKQAIQEGGGTENEKGSLGRSWLILDSSWEDESKGRGGGGNGRELDALEVQHEGEEF